MLKFPIFLDNHSTTRVDPRVLDSMLPYFTEDYGNASSKAHEFGWKADSAVDISRRKIANFINADNREIYFTGGATEAINLAIKGIAEANSFKGDHIITTKAEHKAVLGTCKALERKGFEITYLHTDMYGLVNPQQIIDSTTNKTILVSVIFANNEIGSVNDIAALGKVCRERGIIFHVDAAQAIGKIPVDGEAMNIDLMSFCAHKLYGPKGIGALYIKKKSPKIKIFPQMDGGGHERGMRSGTLNVPGIAGFAKACEIYKNEMDAENNRVKALRDRLYTGIVSNLENVYLNGHPEKRLPGNLNISFKSVDSESIITSMKDIAVSSGSACSSETVEPSHVLKAIGLSKDLIHSSIRFGIGRFNTEEEIDYTINKITTVVNSLRENSPIEELLKEKQQKRLAI